jgi:hypothetical protein
MAWCLSPSKKEIKNRTFQLAKCYSNVIANKHNLIIALSMIFFVMSVNAISSFISWSSLSVKKLSSIWHYSYFLSQEPII